MEIRQFRVVVRAKSFDLTCKFYSESLGLPRLSAWDGQGVRGALFQAGSGVVEVIGRSADVESPLGYDETFDFQGPKKKVTLVLIVPSAEKAYSDLQFREKNIPGGLRTDVDGALIFETHDPDGVKVIFKQADV